MIHEGSLFMDYIRMIDYIRPRFVMENVKGYVSTIKHVPLVRKLGKDDPDQQLGTVLDVILSEF